MPTWTIGSALAAMAGRRSDITIQEQAQRLRQCDRCKHRIGGDCLIAQQVLSVHALKKSNACPMAKWPGDSPAAGPKTKGPRPKPDGPRLLPSLPVVSPWSPAPPERMENLVVITCFWNPMGYKRPVQNWREFSRGISAQGLDLATIELTLDDDPPQLDGPGVYHLRGERQKHLLWQKERLLNLLWPLYQGRADAMAWIDCDLAFLNPRWVEEALAALRENHVVQLFSHAYNRMPSGELHQMKNSSGWYYRHSAENTARFQVSHPGFAWAARTSWFRAVGGLYDRGVTGSGDALMVEGITGYRPHYIQFMDPCEAWRSDLAAWTQRAREATGQAFSYVPGSILHFYHGSKANRKYMERQDYLVSERYNPQTDLVVDETGLLSWSETARKNKPRMIELVAGYFRDRREDD